MTASITNSVRHRIVLTGGGTGGHVYPALAVAEQLKEDEEVEAILYIGARGHVEERLALERHIEFIGLTVGGLPRRLSPKLFTWPFEMAAAIFKARKIMANFRPTAVLGTGGYASAPPLAAAWMAKIPYAIHEPDAHPGLASRAFAAASRLVSLGMEGAAEHLKPKNGKVVVNGNPVGKNFVSPMARDAACAVLGLRPDLKTLLITGGSQGAQALNEIVLEALPVLLELDPPIQIIHQVGEKNLSLFKQRLSISILQNPHYFLRAYFDDLSCAYSVSDLTVCRAGAMTIAELAVSGTPAIFVPYPYAAQDHQTFNARFVESKGAARVMPQSELTAQAFEGLVKEILFDAEKIYAMRKAMKALGRPFAAANLAQQVKALSAIDRTDSPASESSIAAS